MGRGSPSSPTGCDKYSPAGARLRAWLGLRLRATPCGVPGRVGGRGCAEPEAQRPAVSVHPGRRRCGREVGWGTLGECGDATRRSRGRGGDSRVSSFGFWPPAGDRAAPSRELPQGAARRRPGPPRPGPPRPGPPCPARAAPRASQPWASSFPSGFQGWSRPPLSSRGARECV